MFQVFLLPTQFIQQHPCYFFLLKDNEIKLLQVVLFMLLLLLVMSFIIKLQPPSFQIYFLGVSHRTTERRNMKMFPEECCFCLAFIYKLPEVNLIFFSLGYIAYNFVIGAYSYWGPKAGYNIYNMVRFGFGFQYHTACTALKSCSFGRPMQI